jgi:altronate dehydratase
MIFEYNKEKQNNSLTNELIVDIDINIKDLKEISNEIEDMINEIFEDMIAIN